MADMVRLLPIRKSLRDQVEERLSKLDANTATVSVEKADGSVRVAGMVKLKGGWSFMGWLSKGHEDNAIGVQVGKSW